MEKLPQQSSLSGLNVGNLMSTNVICIDENDPVSFIIKVFDRCRISGAPVNNDRGEYVGVISKADLFDKRLMDFLKQQGSLDDLPARYIMNPTPPLSVPEGTSVERAAEIMLQNHIHRIFVKDSLDQIIGVVSSYDILRVVANNNPIQNIVRNVSTTPTLKEQQILNLRDQLSKTPKTAASSQQQQQRRG